MVYVVGMGMISAIGNNVPDCWLSILHNQDGLSKPEILKTNHKGLPVGEIKKSNESLSKQFHLENSGFTRTALLSVHALTEALKDIDKDIYKSTDVAFINGTSVGGMSDVENIYHQMLQAHPGDDVVAYADSLDCADSTMRVAEHFGFTGYQATISTACSSSANAILMGARLIKQGEAKMAICGGADALTRFTLNGFNSLKNVDKAPSKPFDQNRNGLNLGEAAAYIVLVNEEMLQQLGLKPMAIYCGYGNTNEAHHPTAPSPDGKGAQLTMQQALDDAQLEPQHISYINAHGTATLGNDLSEGNAIRNLFGENTPFSSTKAFTGHTLAAAGAVEAIITCLSLKNNYIPINLRFEMPMQETQLMPALISIPDKPLQYAISNSFAFGGNNVSLVFGCYD